MKELLTLMLAAMLTACGTVETPTAEAPPQTPPTAVESTPTPDDTPPQTAFEEEQTMQMQVEVNGTAFSATLADTAAAKALAERLREGPLTLTLRDYAGFEKVGALGERLPAEDSRITTRPGDIVLYTGDQIVLFYGSNTWSYTMLGRIDDLSGWAQALGGGEVELTLSLA